MSSTLHLYRHIIKAAKSFPSIKRVKLLAEIRKGFRENQNLQDKEKIISSLTLASKGLHQLSQYSALPKNRGEWIVNMDNEPMPRPPAST